MKKTVKLQITTAELVEIIYEFYNTEFPEEGCIIEVRGGEYTFMYQEA